eukprot:TRINITY_DN12723_c0_g1_i1.p1 TRINITY_DN12723_c0_g1~~TRINITY_DN12723_c0_g1_i1.p1  ORF type:complete len:711 (+),score=71.99 TRINITY_DN12723_c0_g1_i1:113-2245(+)
MSWLLSRSRVGLPRFMWLFCLLFVAVHLYYLRAIKEAAVTPDLSHNAGPHPHAVSAHTDNIDVVQIHHRRRDGVHPQHTQARLLQTVRDPPHHERNGVDSRQIQSHSHSYTQPSGTNHNPTQKTIHHATRILMFETCGSYAAQRISVLKGVAWALITNRTLVLPHLYVTKKSTLQRVPFSFFYDVEALRTNLNGKISIAEHAPEWTETASKTLISIQGQHFGDNVFAELLANTHEAPILQLDCAYDFRTNAKVINISQAIWEFNSALKLAPTIQRAVDRVIDHFHTPFFTSIHGCFNPECETHCKITGKNCYVQPHQLLAFLTSKQVEKAGPIYFYGTDISNSNMKNFTGIKTLQDLKSILNLEEFQITEPEVISAIHYAISVEADVYLCNAGFLMSNLVMADRESRYKTSIRYEPSRETPFSQIRLPRADKRNSRRLGWVFTLNNSTSYYDSMAKAAVLSAIEFLKMPMYCIYEGSPNELTSWMQDHGVQVIHHKLTWYSSLLSMNVTYDKYDKSSPNYASPGSLAATFLRTDLPIMKELQDIDFVLYTDVDIIFLGPVTETTFFMWPRYFSCGPEAKRGKKFPCNMGIMLMNMDGLRKTHPFFLNYILSSGDLRFPPGPADQGAYNSFYRGRIDAMNPIFNWKPYWTISSKARILHFHGPKLKDYNAWFQKRTALNPLFQYLLKICDQGSCLTHVKIYESYMKQAEAS